MQRKVRQREDQSPARGEPRSRERPETSGRGTTGLQLRAGRTPLFTSHPEGPTLADAVSAPAGGPLAAVKMRTNGRRRAWSVTCALVVAAIAAGVHAGQVDPQKGSHEAAKVILEQSVRSILEPALRKSAGVGFRTFECELPPGLDAGQRFHCEGIDEDGNWLGYSIRIEKDRSATVVLASERASQLDAKTRATLEKPCLRFLEQYDDRDWKALDADLHPALRSDKSYSAASSDLREVRELLGKVRSHRLETHAVDESGLNQLVYALDCERGRLSARFGMAQDDHGVWRLVAFMVSATPGSREQAMLLERAGRKRLGEIIGAPVARLDAPLDRLVRPGDAVEGVAELADGKKMPVRIAQTGWRDDFDPADYSFSILDVVWLLRRALAQRMPVPIAVRCDDAVVPDGGETNCAATGGDGSRLDLVVSRSGGTIRMRRRKPQGN